MTESPSDDDKSDLWQNLRAADEARLAALSPRERLEAERLAAELDHSRRLIVHGDHETGRREKVVESTELRSDTRKQAVLDVFCGGRRLIAVVMAFGGGSFALTSRHNLATAVPGDPEFWPITGNDDRALLPCACERQHVIALARLAEHYRGRRPGSPGRVSVSRVEVSPRAP